MSLERNTIGLIEDDPIMGESLVQRLSLEGADVTWWRTKQDAIKGLEALDADVVICDIRLPDGNGEDVFHAARRRGDVPFLFMTAYLGYRSGGETDEGRRRRLCDQTL